VRTRDICGVDRRCGMAVHSLMMSLVEKGLARRFKKGTYIIERGAAVELAFSRYETYEDKTREAYRPKGLLAYTMAAKE